MFYAVFISFFVDFRMKGEEGGVAANTIAKGSIGMTLCLSSMSYKSLKQKRSKEKGRKKGMM